MKTEKVRLNRKLICSKKATDFTAVFGYIQFALCTASSKDIYILLVLPKIYDSSSEENEMIK